MKLWTNIEKLSEGDSSPEAIIAFMTAARNIGISVFFDPYFPQLMCIASNTDAIEMERKAERGVVSSTPPSQIELEEVA